MDEILAARYRRLVEAGFPNAGSIGNPTMFIDSKAEGVSICGNAGTDYMNIYLKVVDGVVRDIKYLCSCDPAANVVVETLCELARGKTLLEAKGLTKDQFYGAIGTDSGSVTRKVWGAIELLNRVINRFEARVA
jgi:NifU-like protein involved in Fe-S cluster formation